MAGMERGMNGGQPELLLGLAPLSVAVSKAKSIFDSKDYSPMRDMTCQPTHCDCGQPFHRRGACLICKAGHEHWMECVGREDHPRNAEWEAYLDANGRDAFQRAIERHHQQRPWR